MVSGIAFSWCFCFLLSRVLSCCCCRFPSLVNIGADRSLHYLMEVIEVVEVHGPMKGFGMERVVVVVCLSVGLSGFHPRNLFCEESHEEVGMVLV